MDCWIGKEQTSLRSPFRQPIFDTVAAGFDRAVITSPMRSAESELTVSFRRLEDYYHTVDTRGFGSRRGEKGVEVV